MSREFFRTLFSNRKRRNSTRHARVNRGYTRRLVAESLEDRRMLALVLDPASVAVFAQAYSAPNGDILGPKESHGNGSSVANAEMHGTKVVESGTEEASAEVSSAVTPIPGLVVPAIRPSWTAGGAGTIVSASGFNNDTLTAANGSVGSSGGTAGDAHGEFVYHDEDLSTAPDEMVVRYDLEGLWLVDNHGNVRCVENFSYHGYVRFQQVRSNSVIFDSYVSIDGGGTNYSGPGAAYSLHVHIPGYPGEDANGDLFTSINGSTSVMPVFKYQLTRDIQDGDRLIFDSSAHDPYFPELPSAITGSANVDTPPFTYGPGSASENWSGVAVVNALVIPRGSSLGTMPPPQPGDVVSPRVANVTISGSASPDAAYSYATHVGSGLQLQPATVRGADTITLTFSENVFVTQYDLSIVGLHTSNAPHVLSFSRTLNSATWVFTEPFAPDDYQITLDDFVQDGSGNLLDGEFQNPTSYSDTATSTFVTEGNGAAGGDFTFVFNPSPLAVTSSGDSTPDGNYTWGNLTLREAVSIAQTFYGSSTITFAPNVVAAGRVELNGSLVLGSYDKPLHDTLTIAGPAADSLAIDANNAQNVFSFPYNGQSFTLAVNSLMLTGAHNEAISSGGGSSESLTLDGVEITGNGGGVVYTNTNQTLQIRNSTIAENTGLGVNLQYSAPATISNSTISDNQSATSVGGISIIFGSATLTNVTVTNNRADKNNMAGNSQGTGGIYAGGAGTLNLYNTIVAGNFAGKDNYNPVVADVSRYVAQMYSGTINGSYNLIGYAAPSTWGSGSGNEIGTNQASPIDAKLGGLTYYGGHTRTHAVLLGSHAIDTGHDYGLTLDQRGLARPVGAYVDKGAVEGGNLNSLIVTSTGDDNDLDYSYGDFSLREAIGLAAMLPGSSTIKFAPNVVAAGRVQLNSLITVGSPTVPMHDTLRIEGPGADLLAIDANNVAANVFSFVTNSGSYNAVIRGLTLTHATDAAVNSNAANDNLTLDQLEITGNGGGVRYFYGTITISNSTIAQNHGLGVSVAYFTANISNSTISDNHTTGPVAGISAALGSLSLINDTVVNNRADENNNSGISSGVGGVLASTYSSVTLNNTIVAGNLAGKDPNAVTADVGGTMSGSYNLIGYAAPGVWTSGDHNYFSSNPNDIALAALGYYGGHTRTRPPKVTSYAIDHGGNVTNVPTTDQRGQSYIRPIDWKRDGIADFDIGAVELALGEMYTERAKVQRS